MRWQRSIARVLNRWSDQVDPFGHELHEFFPNVVPTIVLGHDLVDDDRYTSTWTTLRPATLGQFAFIALNAIRGSVELLGVRVTGLAAGTSFSAQFGPTVLLYAGTGLAVPTAATDPRTNSGPIQPFAQQEAALLGGGLTGTERVGNETKSLPEFAGTFIEPGYSLVLRTDTANVALGAFFVWRNTGARLS